MRILAINCGSATLKFHVVEVGRGVGLPLKGLVASGKVDRIGQRAAIELTGEDGNVIRQENAPAPDHSAAARLVLDWLDQAGNFRDIDAVGHRVVHGGDLFREPSLIDDRVLRAIERAAGLAPLHNQPSSIAIRAARERLGPDVPMVASFDTAFHADMPKRAALYALQGDLARKHGIRRYGFHGLAHRYMSVRFAELHGVPATETRLITLQLGAGCSAAAVSGGRSIDTTMGFTPLEGLMMATRSGDVDPSLPAFLASAEGLSMAEIGDLLNARSGLLGVSGRSADMRDLLAAEREGDGEATLAIEMFCYRVRKCVGAYLAVLGGAEAVVFGGGIGENVPEVREYACSGLEWAGLKIDPQRNFQVVGAEARISTDDSKLHAYVIPVHEETIIARDTFDCLSSPSSA